MSIVSNLDTKMKFPGKGVLAGVKHGFFANKMGARQVKTHTTYELYGVSNTYASILFAEKTSN